MSNIQNYFDRISNHDLKDNIYARSIKRKFSTLNDEKSNCEKSQKTNSDKMVSPPILELDEKDCILVSSDENLHLDQISVSAKDFSSLQSREKHLQQQNREKVNLIRLIDQLVDE